MYILYKVRSLPVVGRVVRSTGPSYYVCEQSGENESICIVIVYSCISFIYILLAFVSIIVTDLDTRLREEDTEKL